MKKLIIESIVLLSAFVIVGVLDYNEMITDYQSKISILLIMSISNLYEYFFNDRVVYMSIFITIVFALYIFLN